MKRGSTSVQFITYPVQTSDSSLFNRFLTPYNPSTYSPSIAFLFRTNVRLTPLQPLSYPFNDSHSIAFLSTCHPPTYSPSITLLSTHKRPTYSPSIPFLLTYNRTWPLQPSDLPTFKRLTYSIQTSVETDFKRLTYSIQTSVETDFNWMLIP